jgi:hypothetical protein
MTPRKPSRLYRLATGLYARSQSSFEQWQLLNPAERDGYIEAASAMRPPHGERSQQARSDPRQPG